MEQILNIIPVYYTNNEINGIIEKCKGVGTDFTLHFSQNEDFFLDVKKDFRIPHIPVHHDIKKKEPDEKYLVFLKSVLETITPMIAPVIRDTTYFFDSSEMLRPCFYRLYSLNGNDYIYIVRLDLSFKPGECEIIEMGSNDITHLFSSRSIFLDVDIHPVEKTVKSGNGIDIYIKQSVSQTWIGETGRGYFIQGIWIDTELTKFFSKLFTDEKSSTYPYYPFSCKYRTLSHFPVDYSETGREKHIKLLDSAGSFINPYIKEIESVLKDNEFSPDLELFKEIKKQIDPDFYSFFSGYRIKRYLNDRGMKEYELAN